MGYLNYAQFGCGHQLKFPWNKITGSQWFHLMFDWCWSSNAGYTYRNNAEVLLLFLLTRSRFTWMACFQVDPYLTTWSKSDEGESTKWCECKTWPESSVPKQNALTTTRPRSGIQVLGIQGLEKFNIARNHLACHWLTGVGYISLYGTLNALHIAPPTTHCFSWMPTSLLQCVLSHIAQSGAPWVAQYPSSISEWGLFSF